MTAARVVVKAQRACKRYVNMTACEEGVGAPNVFAPVVMVPVYTAN